MRMRNTAQSMFTEIMVEPCLLLSPTALFPQYSECTTGSFTSLIGWSLISKIENDVRPKNDGYRTNANIIKMWIQIKMAKNT